MALDDLGLELNFPTLLVSAYWIEAHCIVPDGFHRGEQFDLVPWQAEVFLNHYRIRPNAHPGQLSTAFHNRRSQVVLPQKAGKAPFSAAQICLEGVGPALFAGWAKGGELYDCRHHGCGCGWLYEYQPGEPMGQRWPTPLIQITATSETQTANIYTALRPMIDEGPLTALIPHTGEEFIRLPNNGRIDPVTSNGRSRLGQRVTFVPWDETGLYVRSNKMFGFSEAVFDTQKRGLTGMSGRGIETTNAWDPNVDSAAADTAKSAVTDPHIYRYHPQAPKGLKYTVRAERRKIHKFVYDGCPWIDLDAIEGDAVDILKRDPGQAARFYGNIPTAGEGAAFDMDVIASMTKTRAVPAGELIVIGADGARYDDDLAIVGCEVRTGHLFPIGIWHKPPNAPDDYEHPRAEVDGAVREAFERFTVWRMYSDEQWIEDLVNGWANSYGDRRVLKWLTNRPRQIAWAVRNFEEAIVESAKKLAAKTARTLTIADHERFLEHFANAQKKTLDTILDDKERPMHTLSKESTHSPLKIDATMAAVLAWEARGDCIAAGAYIGDDIEQAENEKPQQWQPGMALPASALVGGGRQEVGPMGSMS